MLAFISRVCCVFWLWLSLTACQTTSAAPPLEFAPDGEIVKTAIAYQLQLSQTRLSQQLQATPPGLAIDGIKVNQIEPIEVGGLAAYHLRGRYDVTLTLPRQTVTQKHNPFDLYLQRQSEGKSWRLLQRQVKADQTEQWTSDLIEVS